ncbi:MOSC domain-containing protein [Hypoxylon crocopeplum]|nr:MOSC domain-containing protein [Hypoxylon crocopeplum]
MGRNKMRITELYVYPIKSLRPVSVPRTQLRREGLQYDRRFMLLKVMPDGPDGEPRYKNIQTVFFPECTLFSQALDGDHVVVTYRVPAKPLIDPPPREQHTALRVPLDPGVAGLDTVEIKLFGSETVAFRMGDPYDAWFTACLGYRAVLVYIGDNRRPVLAHSPRPEPPLRQQEAKSWFSSITTFMSSYQGKGQEVGGGEKKKEKDTSDGLAFNEAAPFLLTSKASLRDVSARLPEGEDMDMIKFRPNIVVDDISSSESSDSEGGGEGDKTKLQAWDEDFWAELVVRDTHRLALTANCARCVSINIDYETGRPAEGERGAVLKKLMGDRRVDGGNRWSPIFGRYAFLLPRLPHTDHDDDEDRKGLGENGGEEGQLVADVAVGDEVKVTRRISERDVWAWPK